MLESRSPEQNPKLLPDTIPAMRECWFYTYMLASRSRVLYIGVTSNLLQRVHQHQSENEGFAFSYQCNRLVWFERYVTPHVAIAREKQLKRWRREKKLALINQCNPTWEDLSKSFTLSP